MPIWNSNSYMYKTSKCNKEKMENILTLLVAWIFDLDLDLDYNDDDDDDVIINDEKKISNLDKIKRVLNNKTKKIKKTKDKHEIEWASFERDVWFNIKKKNLNFNVWC